ncbi:MAG: putative ABC transporter arginine-binding protein 2 [Hyphomicrobiaceae bacterium hypho_1]
MTTLIVSSSIFLVFFFNSFVFSQVLVPKDFAPREVIRFLTTDDFPPFNSRDKKNELVGFNIDFAWAICVDLSLACDIKSTRWNNLLFELKAGNADVVIAAHRLTPDFSNEFSFSKRYFYTPARFAVRQDKLDLITTPTGLHGLKVAVTANSAYSAYLFDFFQNSVVLQYSTPELARKELQVGNVDALFDDGISLAFWVNGNASKACCVLSDGPYFEPRYFGDGIVMILRRKNKRLRRLIDKSVSSLQANGVALQIIKKFFPIKIY